MIKQDPSSSLKFYSVIFCVAQVQSDYWHRRWSKRERTITSEESSEWSSFGETCFLLQECLLRIGLLCLQGVPIDGYFHWTLSDNWEWADGYGPKFGLVAVDRENDLKRTPRPSYHLYAEVSMAFETCIKKTIVDKPVRVTALAAIRFCVSACDYMG